jgi:hypothetical protein
MRVFKTRSVVRFCKSEGITDAQLADAIARAERGLIDAALGGGLIKQRVARKGQGKSGGWRTLIAYRVGERAVFLFGFAKNDLENVGPAQLADFKSAAAAILNASDAVIKLEVARHQLEEVRYGEED